MDKPYSITELEKRKRGQHLGLEKRGALQRLKKIGFSNHAMAKEINCSPSTVGYELRRGTPEYAGPGRKPGYLAKHGAASVSSKSSVLPSPQKVSCKYCFPPLGNREAFRPQLVF